MIVNKLSKSIQLSACMSNKTLEDKFYIKLHAKMIFFNKLYPLGFFDMAIHLLKMALPMVTLLHT